MQSRVSPALQPVVLHNWSVPGSGFRDSVLGPVISGLRSQVQRTPTSGSSLYHCYLATCSHPGVVLRTRCRCSTVQNITEHLQEEEMEGVFCRLSHWQNVNRRGECSYARPDTGSFKHICNVAIIKWRQHEICNIHAKSCAATSSMLLCISHHPLWSTRGIAGGGLKINLQFPVSNSSEVILGTVFAGNGPECGTRTTVDQR